MAANDYYNSAPVSGRPTVDYNAPLPPVPASSLDPPTNYPVSGSTPHGPQLTSPFDDPADSRIHGPPQQYHDGPYDGASADYYAVGGGPGDPHGPNPFADNIPLKTHASQSTTEYQGGPNHQTLYNPDPATGATDVEPGRKRRRYSVSGLMKPSTRITWFVYAMTTIQVAVFIGELIRNAVLTKSPIMIKPQFNPMIGPSPQLLINMGARFVPCMRWTGGIQNITSIRFMCPNSTTSDPDDPTNRCSLSDLCGFSGVPLPSDGSLPEDTPQPNQWFRFIVPIFLHAGIIHISFNMLLQLTLGRDMEKTIGPLRLALVYFSSGIFGFVFGGNFAPPTIASTGASGCLFGIFALNLLDLLYKWKERRSPLKELAYIMLDIVICFVLGLLPGLDNFSHIGGFLMGLVLGICLLHSPSALRQRIGQGEPPYRPVTTDAKTALSGFIKRPLGFFKGRKPLWWAWWLCRAGALIGVLIVFIVLMNNFYEDRTECRWCKYLSCLPIKNWCDIGTMKFTDSTTPAKRDLASLFH
ncbi:MAG: hypothetical protein M1815_000782 [Lichina confinis]|nr:MAG: hypothetical protein M1815_000782 [Lichina confinis]